MPTNNQRQIRIYHQFSDYSGVFIQSYRREIGTDPSPPHTSGFHWREYFDVYQDRWDQTVTQLPSGEYYGYKARKAAGELIPSLPYLVSSRRTYNRSLLNDSRSSYPSYNWSTGIWTLTNDADDTANRLFYSALNSRSTAQVGIFLVELKQTLGLVSNAILTLVEVIRSLKKGRISDAIDVLVAYGVSEKTLRRGVKLRNRNKQMKISKADYFANGWLELQFGWLTLIQDVHEISETLSNRFGDGEKSLPWFHIRGKGVDSDSFESVPNFSTESYSSVSRTRQVELNAIYTVSNDPIDLLVAFGLNNPAAIAWEVVPFSFVIDWFFPIGNWLNSHYAEAGLSLLDYSESIKESKDIYATRDTHLASDGGSLSVNSLVFQRTVLEEIPDYDPKWVNPIDLIDGWHIATSLALLRQRLSR